LSLFRRRRRYDDVCRRIAAATNGNSVIILRGHCRSSLASPPRIGGSGIRSSPGNGATNESEPLRDRPLLRIRGMTNSANDECDNRSPPTSSRPVDSGNDKGSGGRSHTLAAGNGGGANTNDDDDDEVEEDDDDQTFAALVIYDTISNPEILLRERKMSVKRIIEELPGTHPRDFFSLSLTSLGDAARKKRARNVDNDDNNGGSSGDHRGESSNYDERYYYQHYSVKNTIHPWFILPRGIEIVMAFGCIRALITRDAAYIFDAHKPNIKQRVHRISKQIRRNKGVGKKDNNNANYAAAMRNNCNTQFEVNMVEEIVREVCTMYSRRIHLYAPIVNSLMERVTHESVLPESSLHRLVPLKDSLQRFEMNVKGALRCLTDLLSNDQDMVDLLLTEKAIAKAENRTVPLELHGTVEMMLEEYARQLTSTLLEIDYMLSRVQSKQDMVALTMDANRNRMIRMNLNLTIGGISLAFATTVAGFFGMNITSGYETMPYAFNGIVAGSLLLGGGFMGGCYSHLYGPHARWKTRQHVQSIEIMNRALGDMAALDYSLELMLEGEDDIKWTKEKFMQKVYESEPESIRDSEIDFLFGLLDYTKNGVIDKDDFPQYYRARVRRHRNYFD
jgi:magnesium transporter